MPEKSVREMNELERKHYSLAARTFHATVITAVVLGLVALVIGLGLYTYALTNQYIAEAFQCSRSAVAIVIAHLFCHPEVSVFCQGQILKNVHKSVDEFVKDAEQFDDLTMLCMEYKG